MEYQKHLKSTKRSASPYVDNYTGFIWDGIHSSRYNCFIENTGKLTFEPNPSFSNQFVQPAFQNRSYYIGTQSGTKKFTLNLVFYHLSLRELNEAVTWLHRSKISSLLLDYEPYWRYDCKLASMGTMEKYVDGNYINPDNYQREDLYICKVPVTFESVFRSEAVSIYTVFYSPSLSSNVLRVEPEPPENWFLTAPYFSPTILAEGSESVSDLTEAQALLQNYDPYSYIDNALPRPLVTAVKNDVLNLWDIRLINPTNVETSFRLNCYDVSTSELQLNYSLAEINTEVDAADNTVTILTLVMNLDPDHSIHVHYNSEDGNVLTAGQPVEMAAGYNRHNTCSYAQSLANIYIPAARNGQNGVLHLYLTGSDDWNIEYDLMNNML